MRKKKVAVVAVLEPFQEETNISKLALFLVYQIFVVMQSLVAKSGCYGRTVMILWVPASRINHFLVGYVWLI